MATFSDNLLAAGRGNPPAASALIFLDDLGSEDRVSFRAVWPQVAVERRREIISKLIDMAEHNIDLNFRQVFIAALLDSDPQVRKTAIEGLFEDESSLLLGRLLEMARNDPAEEVREAAALALGRFAYVVQCSDKLGAQAGTLRDALLEIAGQESEQPDVRRRAMESLGYLQGDPEVEKLIADSYESGGRKAESAVYAMGRSLDSRWEQVVMDELESTRPAMRYEAARAAGEMTLADALPFLARMITDRDTEVKLAAIWALGQIGGKPAGEALNQALESSEPAVREAAQEALDELAFNADPLSVGQ